MMDNPTEYHPRDYPSFDVLSEMRSLGGGFVSCLAQAWMHADAVNRAKLYDAFGAYYDEYAERLESGD